MFTKWNIGQKLKKDCFKEMKMNNVFRNSKYRSRSLKVSKSLYFCCNLIFDIKMCGLHYKLYTKHQVLLAYYAVYNQF